MEHEGKRRSRRKIYEGGKEPEDDKPRREGVNKKRAKGQEGSAFVKQGLVAIYHTLVRIVIVSQQLMPILPTREVDRCWCESSASKFLLCIKWTVLTPYDGETLFLALLSRFRPALVHILTERPLTRHVE